MPPTTQAANRISVVARESESPAPGAVAIHAPKPGATALMIHDLRELFKVKVVGLVVITGWGGFYLASMQSGIS
ncbi:MAG: hypothetical protein ACRD25_08950, partial [Terracidiphilus sp.]